MKSGATFISVIILLEGLSSSLHAAQGVQAVETPEQRREASLQRRLVRYHQFITRKDLDKDGKVSRAEFVRNKKDERAAEADKQFFHYDENGDGVLTFEEYRNVREESHAPDRDWLVIIVSGLDTAVVLYLLYLGWKHYVRRKVIV